jgi:predicted molibdopterin-dependent oxidoreductase YjgC
MELLWADHAGKCATCKKNGMCELQNLAKEYGIENFRFVPRKDEMTSEEELDLLKDNRTRIVVEEKNPCIGRTSEFCVECRRCINVCPEKKFGFNYRAGDSVVGTPYEKELDCSFCGKCVEVCPTAALIDQNDHKKIIKILDNAEKFSVLIIPEKLFVSDLEKMGFEKIIKISEKESLEEKAKEFKTKFAQKEKINPEEIAVFAVSNDISKKKNKKEFTDYFLTEREVKRLIRDKKK